MWWRREIYLVLLKFGILKSMKRGLKQGRKTKQITLTLDKARTITGVISSGQSLTSRNSKNLLVEGYAISKNTYQTWLRSGTVPVDAPKGHSLSQMVAKARTEGKIRSAKQSLKHGSQKHLMSLLNMDLSVTEKSVRRYRGGKSMVTTELYTPISPELLGIKLDASMFALSSLDPAYKN